MMLLNVKYHHTTKTVLTSVSRDGTDLAHVEIAVFTVETVFKIVLMECTFIVSATGPKALQGAQAWTLVET
jgi:hypothetical protein